MVEKRDFSYPLAFDAPGRGVPWRPSPPVWYRKTRMVWLPGGEKISFEDIFIRFGATHEREGRTHARTDGHRVTAYTTVITLFIMTKTER